MHRAAVLVACLAVLAGCSALTGTTDGPPTTLAGDGDAGWPTETTASPTADSPPPGLTSERVTDPIALAAAHRDRLQGTSYALRWTATDRVTGNGTETARTDHRGRFAARPGRYRSWVAEYGTTRSVREVWADGGTAYTRVGDAAEADRSLTARPSVLESAGVAGFAPTKRRFVTQALTAFGDREVVEYRTRQGVRYLVRSETLVAPENLPGADGRPVSNATLQAVVYPDGVVHGLLVTYDVTHEGTTYTRTYDLDVSGVGSTTVERPDWVTDSAKPSDDRS